MILAPWLETEAWQRKRQQYAEEDAKRREAVEARNQGDQLVYTTEKFLTDNEDKLPDDVKSEVRADVDALKTALAGTDDAAVDAAVERLQQSQGKLGEAIYAAGQDAPAESASESTKDDEDIIDAEVVDDEDEKDSAK